MDVDRLAVDYGPASGVAAAHGPLDRHRGRPEPRHQPEHVAVYAKHLSIARVTQPCGVLSDYLQHGLDIRRRAGDYSENLTRRRLLLKRFGEIAVAFLQF